MNHKVRVLFKAFLYTVLFIVGLLVCCILTIRIPSVQNFIVHKAASFVSSKTHSQVALQRLYIDFKAAVVMEGLFLEDERKDTLLYFRSLEIGINIPALLKKEINVHHINLSAVTANVYRNMPDSAFNFDFMIEALAGNSGDHAKPEGAESKTPARWKISVDEIALENIRAVYDDQVSGNELRASFGKLSVTMNEIDLQRMFFNVNEINLQDAAISFIQHNESLEVPDTTIPGPFPSLNLNKAHLQHVVFHFSNDVSEMGLDVALGELMLKPEIIDLNKQHIAVNSMELSQTYCAFKMKNVEEPGKETKNANTSSTTRGWTIESKKLTLNEVAFNYDVINEPRLKTGMDYNHMHFKHVNMELNNSLYSTAKIRSDIAHLSCEEESGLNLKKLQAKAEYDAQHAKLSELKLITNVSTIGNHIEAGWPSLESLKDNLHELKLNCNLSHTKIALSDVLLFAPFLKEQIPLSEKETIQLSGKINGTLGNLNINHFLAKTAENTGISFDASIQGLPDARQASYNLTLHSLTTSQKDVTHFTKGKLIPVKIPEQVLLTGTLAGRFTDFESNIALKTSEGSVAAIVKLKQVGDDTTYQVNIKTDRLHLGHLLNQNALGALTLQTEVQGKNFDLSRIQTFSTTQINTLTYNDYDYHNIKISVDATKETFASAILINDKFIQLNSDATVSISKGKEFVRLNLNMAGANLTRLNWSKEDIRVSGKMNLDLKGHNVENLSGHGSLNKIVIIKNDRKYQIDSFLVGSFNENNREKVKIQGGFLNFDYDGSLRLQQLSAAITNHINTYYTISDTENEKPRTQDTIAQDFMFALQINPNPVINDVLLPDLRQFQGAKVKGSFNNRKNELTLSAYVPKINYGGTEINGTNVSVVSNHDNMMASLQMASLQSGNMKLANTSLNVIVKNDSLGFKLTIGDKGNTKLDVSGKLVNKMKDGIRMQLANTFIIENRNWTLPADHYIRLNKNQNYVHHLQLTDGIQMISLSHQHDAGNAPFLIDFKNFELGTISQLVEKDTAIVRGTVNGNVQLKSASGKMAFTSELDVKDITYLYRPIGNLSVRANNLTPNKYEATMRLSGFDNRIHFHASYLTSGTQPINAQINIEKLYLKTLESFVPDQIRNGSGFIHGGIAISGSLNKPSFNGVLTFNQAAFNIAAINNYIKLNNEKMEVNDKGLHFNKFTITDSIGHKATVNGSIYTTDFNKMKFDIQVKTQKFTVLNTRSKDNPLYFGRIVLSSSISIKGNESLPVVDADLKLLSETRLTIILPSSQLSTDRGEGIVSIIDTVSQNDIMAMIDSVKMMESFKGINLHANIFVDPQTRFKIIVDRVSGDSLVAGGEAQLSFSMDASGKQSLTGTYLLNYGTYNASFQKVIKRDFTIKPGSYITWNGSPMDANIDLTAIYTTRTSPSSLMATELSTSSPSERNAYRKLLPFDVNMNMKGMLLRPEISFQIEMRDRDKNAFGGAVYSKLTALNADPNQLNKQVFALLILNRFMPEGQAGNTGENNAVNTIARNSVNQVLSDQLNQLSGRYIKNVELNFDIQSNDNYTGTSVEENTEVSVGLKKDFLNDKLSVQVGSSINVQNNNPSGVQQNTQTLTGDVIVEYKITDDGRYRFKAFRDNQYEGTIDGLLNRTGVGIIYTRDYNRFKELFSPPKKEEEDIEEPKP